MAETESNFSANPPPVAPRGTAQIISTSAVEALGSAMVLWLLGGVAISVAGSFAGDMIPSMPPGFGGHHSWGDHPYRRWHVLRESAFIFFIAVFFIHSLWVGFHGRSRGRILRILANLRHHWFGLVIGNAISAWVAVLLLGILPDISLWHMLWHWLLGLIHPLLEGSAHFIFGNSTSSGLKDWLSWFDANQMKLIFWIIYFGGAFDDLGVPNYKALARWAWRRMQKRKRMAVQPTAERADLA